MYLLQRRWQKRLQKKNGEDNNLFIPHIISILFSMSIVHVYETKTLVQFLGLYEQTSVILEMHQEKFKRIKALFKQI